MVSLSLNYIYSCVITALSLCKLGHISYYANYEYII